MQMQYNMPAAFANIRGGSDYPNIRGTVYFYPAPGGTRICAYIRGLPDYKPASATPNGQPIGPFGFHIHEIGCCDGDFSCAGEHFNPTNQPHGNHAADFPVLFSNGGYSEMCFYTNKFNVQSVIGRSVVIHENPDDYRTQPAGNSGKRIACGIIRPYTPA